MSGIVGIVNLDGAPVDRGLLSRMTQFLAARGPDAQEIWTAGNVGFGHTLLKTTFEAEREHQPLTLDDQAWITADCRVDGREDLIRELAGHGRAVQPDAPDPELILHAYAVWGESCCEHLLGDFAFAIWDARRQALFCARDHFGVKPFLYAYVGATVVFSNMLSCVRLHPAVSSRLDELTVADLLMFGTPQDLDATAFSDIRRLPPAHVAAVQGGAPRVKPYCELPKEDELRYRRRGEYTEHFRELLEIATRDRLRTNKVGVLMSGGLDSPTVAATARRILAGTGSPFDLRAHNVFYEHLVPDEERKWSAIAAEGIGIPIHHYPMDDYRFPLGKPAPAWYPQEPGSVFDGNAIEIHREPVARSPVLLTGYGADPLIDLPSIKPMLQQRRYGRLFRDYVWLTWVRRQFVKPGIRTLLRERFSRRRAEPAFLHLPDWLEPGLARRFDLAERWKVRWWPPVPAEARPMGRLSKPFWPYFLEYSDPGSMGLPGELRHPFLDLRLVRFLSRLPPFPWFMDKSLLRVGMQGVLPKAILRRPKAPLAGNPWAMQLPPAHTHWWEHYLVSGNGLENFVDIGVAKTNLARVAAASQTVNDHADIDMLRQSLRPVGLGLWLQNTSVPVVL